MKRTIGLLKLIVLSVLLVVFLTTTALGEVVSESVLKECKTWAQITIQELGREYELLIDPPFVLAGNMSRSQLEYYLNNTIYKASMALWKKFFDKHPKRPIRILLFANERSYRSQTKILYGDNDVSYFGYFRPDERTILMNISTGDGTLVHELTHALMAPDFPICPVWFEEAMGSLFEQCSLENDDIRGLMNWRFPILQRAINNNELIPLIDLLKVNRTEFEGEYRDLYYAEARYLALYLQEKEVLVEFYKAFRDVHQTDLFGHATLEHITGKKLEILQKEWIHWTETLKQ
ncbi:MAG: hypothetical protein ACMUJM_20155 [bacterium]